jgi:hypothetical protein
MVPVHREAGTDMASDWLVRGIRECGDDPREYDEKGVPRAPPKDLPATVA